MKPNFEKAFSLLSGSLDSLTGLGLVFMPATVVSLMGLAADGYQQSLLRFIGAFVFAAGNLYLWGCLLAHRSSSLAPLRSSWLATAWIRLCVCAVTGCLIARGELELAWVSVPLTDGLLAAFQLLWVTRKERWRDDQ